MGRPLSGQIDIEAPRERVWQVVSDLAAMGRRSPQCRHVLPLGPVREGTVLLNLNTNGRLWWPMVSRVTRWDPPNHLAFRVLGNGSLWSYTLTDLPERPGHTLLTERRDLPRGPSRVSGLLVHAALGGDTAFDAELLAGIEATLAAVKAEAEATA